MSADKKQGLKNMKHDLKIMAAIAGVIVFIVYWEHTQGLLYIIGLAFAWCLIWLAFALIRKRWGS